MLLVLAVAGLLQGFELALLFLDGLHQSFQYTVIHRTATQVDIERGAVALRS